MVVYDESSVENQRHADVLRVLLGSALAASRRVAPRPPSTGPDPRYVALGVVCVVEDRLGGLVRAGAGVTRAAARPVAAVAAPLVPGVVRRSVTDAVRTLDRYGRTAAADGSEQAVELATTIADDVVHDPNMLHIVEEIIDRVQWHVVDSVLPVVLDRLAAEPEQVRALVQGQSRGMIDELATSARTTAAEGDEAVDRLLARILHRQARARRRSERDDGGPTVVPSSP